MSGDKKYTIYILENKITSAVYVGRTCRDLTKVMHAGKNLYKRNEKLYSDIEKYG